MSFAFRFLRALSLSLIVTPGVATPVLGVGSADAPAAPSLPMASPEAVGMSSVRLERLTAAMQGYVDRHEVAGTVTLVARKGKVVHLEALGWRDAENRESMTSDVIFRIASMTKPITSVALMMLWEEGKFQLRDPIADWLPEFSEMSIAVQPAADEYWGQPFKTVPATKPITVQQILTHTAGFPNSYRGLTRDLYTKLASQTLEHENWTVTEYVTALAALPLNFEPGSQWQYGPSTTVAGRLVEVLSGQTLDAFFQERIFEPLGMADTHFCLPKAKLDRYAALYRPDDSGRITLAEAPDESSRAVRQPCVFFSGAGGLVSTAADYFRFHQMMLQGGELDGVRILGPKTIEMMTGNHIGNLGIWLRGPGYGFGLGYSVVTDVGQSAMPASLGSYSWGGAYSTVFWVDPEEELIAILMTQLRPYTHLNIRQDLQSLVYQAIIE